MKTAKRLAPVIAAGLLALIAPTSADARYGWFAAGAFAGFAAGAFIGAALGGGYWGPYPYYDGYPAPLYYYPPAPYWGRGPVWAPYGYYGGCYRHGVWYGHYPRYVRVC